MESKKQNKQNKKQTQIQRTNWWLPEGWEWELRETDEGDEEGQTSSYKINKPIGYKIQHKEYGQ